MIEVPLSAEQKNGKDRDDVTCIIVFSSDARQISGVSESSIEVFN